MEISLTCPTTSKYLIERNMKEATLNIPEHRWSAFATFAQQLGLEINETVDICEEHKAIVRERMRTAQRDHMIPWERARQQLVL